MLRTTSSSTSATRAATGKATRSSIETKNFNGKTSIGGNGIGMRHSDQMTLTERLTRVDPEMVEYRATVNDPLTYTAPLDRAHDVDDAAGLRDLRVLVPRSESRDRGRARRRAQLRAARSRRREGRGLPIPSGCRASRISRRCRRTRRRSSTSTKERRATRATRGNTIGLRRQQHGLEGPRRRGRTAVRGVRLRGNPMTAISQNPGPKISYSRSKSKMSLSASGCCMPFSKNSSHFCHAEHVRVSPRRHSLNTRSAFT